MSSQNVGSFFIQHKQHRASVPDLRYFCERHPQHFAVVDPGKGHWKLRLAANDEEAVQKLADFIASRGGMVQSKEFPDFHQQYPALAKVVYFGGRTLRQFCELHETRILVNLL